ncbi:MAG: YpdA family putative bacillithiol disulfide reductase [Cellulophaga sp.]|uniref:YpdA family putative bacillithiol disulfide reductase n=1 Tax=unclassified Cellulophaga TaxID=2634405 RepID=UPI0026E30BA5|nr:MULTISPECIES: YpdA family putative bacillithiol disulfide reductase [unclassified Cellulophaga]MDO6490441.1 YpdA family putative bacillithiol disulfide reductase [Cellulophaga sp. 2_MG-2023]MDO6494365.1 YpdA family putative bacillithiol disulfide reductase [Cellulophaga sp. 3_MG-2023]
MNLFDVIIIGGGPIGIACGLEAKKNGLSYLILEKGCIVNSLYNYPAKMQFFSSSEKLEIDNIPFISNEAKPKKEEALEYYRRIVSSNDLDINLFEKVTNVTKDSTYYIVKTSKTTYTANNVIIATGFYDIPNKLNIPGEDLPKVTHYYNNPHYFSKQKVAVVGASNSSIDAALECWRKGAEVTLIIRGAEVGQRVKYWVRPDIINRIEEGSIKVIYNANITEIKETQITIKTVDGAITLQNDYVLALTGYRPNFDFLTKMGITLSNDAKKIPTHNTDTMETNLSNVYLAGVICGGMETHKWFIENSRIHAKKIISTILQKK